VSWLEDLDDDDEPEFDEADIRVRPNPKANRPRTKRRPAHADAEIARVLGVDRGRYTVLVDEDGPEEHTVSAVRARELRNLGGEAHELEDGIRVVPQPLHGGRWRAHHDHRLATTGALIGLGVPGVEIDDIGTTAKTMPQFPELWQRMLDGHGAPDALQPEAMQAS